MLKIVIAIPPVRDFYWTPHRASFLGARLVKLYLEKYFNVTFYSCLTNKAKIIPLPSYLNYLDPYLNSKFKFSFFKNFKHFGRSFEKCVEDILKLSPDVVIIPIFAFCYSEEALFLGKLLKKKNPDIYLCVGGAGVTVFAHYFKKFSFIDLIITGEIEMVIDEVISAIKNRDKRIIYNKKLCNQENLDFILIKTFETQKIVSYSTILSRGCPKNCTFCSNRFVFGNKFRLVPIKKIEKFIKNFKFLNKKIVINFEDDNILMAKDYFFEVLNLFKFYNQNILFSFENGLYYNLLDENTLIKLLNLEIKQFNFSIVNINKKIAENSKRILNIDHLKEVVKIILKFNGNVVTYFIAGLSEDSLENILRNIHFIKSLNSKVGFSAFYPVPGLFESELKIKEKLLNGDIFPGILRGSAMKPWFHGVSVEDLITGFMLTRMVNDTKLKVKVEGGRLKGEEA